MSSKWYKIDNAGKIFPTVWSKEERSSFRLSAVLKDEVDESLLKIAVTKALQRFPTFNVKLRRGFFWYYLEANNKEPIIEVDKNIFSKITLKTLDGYLFKVTYYGRRVAIDIFHAITDGKGGMEFFKCILYYYFELLGGIFENKGEILTHELEQFYDEKEDSFIRNYNKKDIIKFNEPKVHKIKNVRMYGKGRFGVYHTILSVSQIKEVCRKYDCTVTEYISSCMLQSIYQNEYNDLTKDEIYTLFVTVNARKYFNSKTLRNFALFIRSSSKFKDNMEFTDFINESKTFFKRELTKERLQSRIVQNVNIEKNFFVRALPLFLKILVMKIGYKFLADDLDTMNFSNLGVVNCPAGFEKYIERFEFILGASKSLPMGATCISYNDTLVYTASLACLEKNLLKKVLDQFVKDGLECVIEMNDLEVEDEEMSEL